MNLLGRRHVSPPKAREGVRSVRIVGFERTLGTGTHGCRAAGVLTYTDDDNLKSVAVGITWEALAQLRAAAALAGFALTDDQIVYRVLPVWCRKQLEAASTSSPSRDGLVLASLGGPLSSEPMRLLALGGLAPSV